MRTSSAIAYPEMSTPGMVTESGDLAARKSYSVSAIKYDLVQEHLARQPRHLGMRCGNYRHDVGAMAGGTQEDDS